VVAEKAIAAAMFTIEIADQASPPARNDARLKDAVRLILKDAGIRSAEISIAIVTDDQIHQLNRQYLQHDYATDVLSFVLDHDEQSQTLEGQIIVSADYAAREAPRYGWTTSDELLLYVIHGALHLVGHDDTTPAAQQSMRAAETKYLHAFGLNPSYVEKGSGVDCE
jgi:probable rRNA maturation factor